VKPALLRVRTFAALVVFLLCCSSPVASATAQTSTGSGWGVLADLAEHDFSGSGLLVTARWKDPGKVLAVTLWGFGGRQEWEFERHPSTGEIEQRVYGQVMRNFQKGMMTVAADGSLMFKTKRFLSKTPEGVFMWGTMPWRSIAAGDKAAARLADLIARGKVRAANPAMATASPIEAAPRPAAVAAAGMQAAPVARPEPSMKAVSIRAEGPRIALIIGNSAYIGNLNWLPNPVNDAEDIAAALRRLGFDVEVVKNADQRAMKRAIARFGERLRAAGKSATGLFFYAGHGIQSRGINYLVPVGAAITAEADVDLESVAADTILLQMEEAGSATNVVILDACRNMPLARSFRSASRGLAPMDAPNGSFIAYSTAPGSTAADGAGRNSPFATALLSNIMRQGEPIEAIFRDVRRTVIDATGGSQRPWDASSLVEPFYFAGKQ
jgi:hypothetical protein